MLNTKLTKLFAHLFENATMAKHVVVALICLSLYSFFPTNGFLEDTTKGIFFLILLPILYIKFITKKDIRNFGLSFGDKEEGLFWGSAMLLASLAIFYLLIQYTSFSQEYVKIMPRIANKFSYFLIYELVLINLLFLIQEIFFKGFFLSILRDKLEYLSIIIQAGVYSIPLLLIAGNVWTVIPMVILSLTGGVVAYKSKTFFYSYLSGIVSLIILDSYIIYLIK